MNIHITGINGYIGQELAKKLTQLDYNVTGSDLDIYYKSRIYLTKDIVSYPSSQTSIDVVVHLAATRSAPWSMQHPTETIYNNITSTQEAIKLAKQHNAKLIAIGSMGQNGYEVDGIITENSSMPLSHMSYYHMSKSIASTFLQKASKDIDVIELIQGTVWGVSSIFDYDVDFGTVVNRFMLQSVLDIPLTVYGTGNQKRTFIHISDSINYIKKAIEKSSIGYKAFNQFSDVLTINDISKLISNKKINLSNVRKEKDNINYIPCNATIQQNLGLPLVSLHNKIDVQREIQKLSEIVKNKKISIKELTKEPYKWKKI